MTESPNLIQISSTYLALIFGPYILGYGLSRTRRLRDMGEVKTSDIVSAPPGLVHFQGKAIALSGTTTPFSNDPCCWWHLKIFKSRRVFVWGDLLPRQLPAGTDYRTSGDFFCLQDHSGTVLIDPEGAEVVVKSSTVSRGHNRFASEQEYITQKLILPGDFISVVGELVDFNSAQLLPEDAARLGEPKGIVKAPNSGMSPVLIVSGIGNRAARQFLYPALGYNLLGLSISGYAICTFLFRSVTPFSRSLQILMGGSTLVAVLISGYFDKPRLTAFCLLILLVVIPYGPYMARALWELAKFNAGIALIACAFPVLIIGSLFQESFSTQIKNRVTQPEDKQPISRNTKQD